MIETKRNKEDTAVVCGLQMKQRAVLNRPRHKEASSSAEIHGESRNPGWMGGRLETVEGPKSLWLNLNRGAVECQNVLYPASLQIWHVQVFPVRFKMWVYTQCRFPVVSPEWILSHRMPVICISIWTKEGRLEYCLSKIPVQSWQQRKLPVFSPRHFKDWQEIPPLPGSVKSHPTAVVGWWSTRMKPHQPHFNSPLTTEQRRNRF